MGVLLLALPAIAPVYFVWRDICDRAEKERAVDHEIKERAYEIYEQRVREGRWGNASDDWNRARHEIFAEHGWA